MGAKKAFLVEVISMIMEVLLILKGFTVCAVVLIIIMSAVIWKSMGKLPAFFFSLALTLLFVVFYFDIPKITASISVMASFVWLLQKYDHKEMIRLAEESFYTAFGINPDKVEFIFRPPTRHELEEIGISEAVQIKTWSEGKASKFFLDIEKRLLQARTPILFPVYSEDVIPLWKEVIRTHKQGNPKHLEYYDDNEILQKVDYLSENGSLLKGSWRRHRSAEEYWNTKKKVWEPVP